MQKTKQGNDEKLSAPDHTKPEEQDSDPKGPRECAPDVKKKTKSKTILPSHCRVSFYYGFAKIKVKEKSSV